MLRKAWGSAREVGAETHIRNFTGLLAFYIGSTTLQEDTLKISKTALAGPLAVALAIPAFAIGQGTPPASDNAKPPATAYGVMCERAPHKAGHSEQSPTRPDRTQFSECVRAFAQGTNGQSTPQGAAKRACAENPALTGTALARCVASSEALVKGLRGLKAQQ